MFVWGGLPHGTPDAVTKALGGQSVKNIVAVDFQRSLLSELASVTLPSTTYVETAGSWINHDLHLQAFRAAMRYPLEGRIGTELLQELLYALGEGETEGDESTRGTPQGVGTEDPMANAVTQRGWEGAATIPVFAGSGEVAVKSRKTVVGPAAVFNQLAEEVPQFGGHTHLSLIKSHGARLA